MNIKTCTKCQKDYPATTEYFYFEKHGKYGLRSTCKECDQAYRKEYVNSHKKQEAEYIKQYRQTERGKESNRESVKKYQQTDGGKRTRKKATAKYNKSEHGRALCRKAEKKYKDNKYKNDITYRLNVSMSVGIRSSLLNGKAGIHWESLLDYTVDELKEHLESRFKPGMSWDNYGEWHIDHIIPKSKFNFSDFKNPQFKKCWSLDNLQPLWAIENIRKGNRIEVVASG